MPSQMHRPALIKKPSHPSPSTSVMVTFHRFIMDVEKRHNMSCLKRHGFVWLQPGFYILVYIYKSWAPKNIWFQHVPTHPAELQHPQLRFFAAQHGSSCLSRIAFSSAMCLVAWRVLNLIFLVFTNGRSMYTRFYDITLI